MNRFIKQFIALAAIALLVNVSFTALVLAQPAASTSNQPAWIKNAVIYEVNMRQYSKSGSIKDFESNLPRLKAMGVDVLWFMPVQPIGELNRKGKMGSYYSIKDYDEVNKEFGTKKEFANMIKDVHGLNMYAILDWVPNHTAWDHDWAKQHPEWYKQENGQFAPPYPDWSDVIKLDYTNSKLREAMTMSMINWVSGMKIDGFRCDVAGEVPSDFWEYNNAQLRAAARRYNGTELFMLAESDKKELFNRGFNCTYGWEFHFLMNQVAKGEKSASDITAYIIKDQQEYKPNEMRMYFTSNHDENSWKGTEYERLGAGVKAFAALSFVMDGIPLIYTGQETGLNKRLAFFEKDPVDWKKNHEMEAFYTQLTSLKHNNAALFNGDWGGRIKNISNNKQEQVVSFLREKDNNRVVFIMNTSAKKAKVKLAGNGFEGKYVDYFTKQYVEIAADKKIKLKPYQYLILVK